MRGSTLVPSRVTTSPSTSTTPASISSSHLRREATPDWASSFCSRIRPVVVELAIGHVGLGAAVASVLGPGSGVVGPSAGPPTGQLVLHVVHVGEVRRQLGQLVERGDADPLQEVAGGAVEVGAVLAVLAGLLDQPAGEQGAHHAVDVDAADRRDPGPGDRLLVGDHGQRLQRGLGEPGLLAVEDEPLDDRRRTPRGCRSASRRRRCAARSRGPARRTRRRARPARPRPRRPGSRRRRPG